jgi:hypothetical protein
MLKGDSLVSFTPVVHQPTRTTANTHDNLLEIICLFAGVFEQRRTTVTVWICFHTAEVAGSNPASPTSKNPANSRKIKAFFFAPGILCSNRAATRTASPSYTLSVRTLSSGHSSSRICCSKGTFQNNPGTAKHPTTTRTMDTCSHVLADMQDEGGSVMETLLR